MKKIKYESFLTAETHLHIQNGNRKLGQGIYTVNLLSGDKPLTLKDGTILTNVSGTCDGCCDGCKKDCYAIKTQLRYNNDVPTWADNTLLAKYDVVTFFGELQSFINKNVVAVIRYHALGEIPSFNYLFKAVELANNNPNIRFYLYTKRFQWIEQYINTFGDFPKNFVVNVSIWHNNYKNLLSLPEFIYDDGTQSELESVVHCPAVDKSGNNTGVTCAMCKRCINAKQGTRTAVYAH